MLRAPRVPCTTHYYPTTHHKNFPEGTTPDSGAWHIGTPTHCVLHFALTQTLLVSTRSANASSQVCTRISDILTVAAYSSIIYVNYSVDMCSVV